MATYDHTRNHMVTFGFFDFKLIMVYEFKWSFASAHAKEPYATIYGITGASRRPRRHREGTIRDHMRPYKSGPVAGPYATINAPYKPAAAVQV